MQTCLNSWALNKFSGITKQRISLKKKSTICRNRRSNKIKVCEYICRGLSITYSANQAALSFLVFIDPRKNTVAVRLNIIFPDLANDAGDATQLENNFTAQVTRDLFY